MLELSQGEDNDLDCFAVSVIKGVLIVSHVPSRLDMHGLALPRAHYRV